MAVMASYLQGASGPDLLGDKIKKDLLKQMPHKSAPPRILKAFPICVFSVLSLFLGFFTNYWRVAEQPWFEQFERYDESFILGRMVMSRQHGMFSSGGLTGRGSLYSTQLNHSDDPVLAVSNQYLAYANDLSFEGYKTYDSQIGGQGIFFSILNNVIKLPPDKNLRLFHALTSLFSAITLTAIVWWFYLEFGLTVALFVLASAIFSQWLVVFGRNLWWSIWAFYLPMTVVMHYLRSKLEAMNIRLFRIGVIVCSVVFIKCLFTGYEYITTALVMMTVPLVYYGMLIRWSLRKFLIVLFTTAVGSCLAIFLTFLILCFQIAAVKGSFLDGVNHIAYSFAVRTHANPQAFPSEYTSSLESGTAQVVAGYLRGTYFDANNYLPRSKFLPKFYYYRLMLVFAVMSAVLYFGGNRSVTQDEKRKRLALIVATWFSILAPLSWFVIFKAHSYMHFHMNFIVWQMPFVLFGFAVCGLAVKSLLSDLSRLVSVSRLRPRVETTV
jgi:hypothetical protein